MTRLTQTMKKNLVFLLGGLFFELWLVNSANAEDKIAAMNQIMANWEGSIVQTSTVKKITSPDDGLYNSWPDTPRQ